MGNFSVFFGRNKSIMYGTLKILHSLNRYVVLVLLIVLIVRSLMGWLNRSEFKGADNKVSLFTLIFTHIQFLVGLVLYFVSPFVVFGGPRDRMQSYWTFEHITIMLIAVVLITVGRNTMKKISEGPLKHKRLFIFNLIAILLVVAGIAMSKRGFFSLPF